MNMRKHSADKLVKSGTGHPYVPDDYNTFLHQIRLDVADSRDRLTYVIKQTAQAAECVLNAVENAQPIQNELAGNAQELSTQWQRLLAADPVVNINQQEIRAALMQTIDFLNEIPKKSNLIRQFLLEILMTQSHQDLSGQVMQKMLRTFDALEQKLPSLEKDIAPTENRSSCNETELMNGPVINHTSQQDAFISQDQIDGLLAKLGR